MKITTVVKALKGTSWAVLAVVIAIGAIVPGLQAGPSAVGRFKLPFAAEWAGTTLSTGDYTISLDRSVGSYGAIVVYQGSQVLEMVLPQTVDRFEEQRPNPALLCIRHDGKITVRALRLPNVGTFYFALPANLQSLVAQQPQLIETVSVQLSGE